MLKQSTNRDDTANRARLVGLDGVRAIAILLVLLWHVSSHTRFPVAALGPLQSLVQSGWAGVDLFFALSGFLITTLILREEAREDGAGRERRFSLWRFYLRRSLRILPIFYAVFLLNTYVLSRGDIFSSIHLQVFEARSPYLGLLPFATFWCNYLEQFLHTFGGGATLVSPGPSYWVYWSLCVEEHFYLFWPVLLTVIRTGRGRLIASLGICAISLALRLAATASHTVALFTIHITSHYRFDAIVWGAIAALLHDGALVRLGVRRAALGLLGVASVVLFTTKQLSVSPEPTVLGVTIGYTIVSAAAAALVLELAGAPTTLLARSLDVAPLRLLGRLSYAIYLIQFPIIDLARAIFFSTAAQPTLGALLQLFALALILAMLAALVLHHVIERPFLALKTRF